MLSNQREKGGFREVNHLLLVNWLGIGPPTEGGKWLSLHHLSCFSLPTLLLCLLHSFIFTYKFSFLLFLSSGRVSLGMGEKESEELCSA